MKTIESHKPFDKFYESRGKIYAVLETSEKTVEDSEEVLYVAKVIEITMQEKANRSLLKSKLYREIADPLFFKSQRNAATKEEWLKAVEKIEAIGNS